MRIPKLLLAITVLSCFFSFQSCKKSHETVTPPATPSKPDTLTAGWSKITVPGETGSGDVFFNSPTTGYLVGSKIHKSTDGGNTWNAVSTTTNIYNVFMTNDGKAFFAGPPNTILKTIDGGSNFVNTVIGTTAHDLFFTDNNNGYSVTQNGLYATADGGLSWSKIITTGLGSGGNYSSLFCINNTTGWVVTEGGIYRSVGSFANWQQSIVTGGFGGGSFVSVYAASATTVYVANQVGEIFKSTDGGINFSRIKVLDTGSFTDLHFLTDQLGYACSGSRIYKTTDGGLNWSAVVSLGESGVIEIHFTDATHGWACGGGYVYIFKQ